MSPAPFEADVELDGGVRVIAVRGELDLGTAPELEPAMEQAVTAGDEAVLIDLSACEFIDSTGIALIVRTWQRLEAESNDGARVVIASANDQVRRVLEITGLELSIPIHASRDEALAALRN